MNCFDCESNGVSHPAVATCVHCGAGICRSHATIAVDQLVRIELVNREAPVEPPARHIYCDTCAAAIDAQQHPHEHAAHFPHRHN